MKVFCYQINLLLNHKNVFIILYVDNFMIKNFIPDLELKPLLQFLVYRKYNIVFF